MHKWRCPSSRCLGVARWLMQAHCLNIQVYPDSFFWATPSLKEIDPLCTPKACHLAIMIVLCSAILLNDLSPVWMKMNAWVKWVFSLVGLSYEMFWPGNLELGHRDDRELVGGALDLGSSIRRWVGCVSLDVRKKKRESGAWGKRAHEVNSWKEQDRK